MLRQNRQSRKQKEVERPRPATGGLVDRAVLDELVRDFGHEPEQIDLYLGEQQRSGRLGTEAFAEAWAYVSSVLEAQEPPLASSLAHEDRLGGASVVRDADLRRARMTEKLLGELSGALRLPLSEIDVSVDSDAAARTEARGARGLMDGGRVYLHPRAYDPSRTDGRALLAHELTHLAQRRMSGGTSSGGSALAEVEARRAGDDFAAGLRPTPPLVTLSANRAAADNDAHPGHPTYEVAGDSFHGIVLYYIAEPDIPTYDICGIDEIEGKHYQLVPYLRKDGSIVAYGAWNRQMRRHEYVVGPESLSLFLAKENELHAVTGFAYPLSGGKPRAYEVASARAVQRLLEGDAVRAFDSWRRSWGEAVSDPFWWLQVAVSLLLGASAAPRSGAARGAASEAASEVSGAAPKVGVKAAPKVGVKAAKARVAVPKSSTSSAVASEGRAAFQPNEPVSMSPAHSMDTIGPKTRFGGGSRTTVKTVAKRGVPIQADLAEISAGKASLLRNGDIVVSSGRVYGRHPGSSTVFLRRGSPGTVDLTQAEFGVLREMVRSGGLVGNARRMLDGLIRSRNPGVSFASAQKLLELFGK